MADRHVAWLGRVRRPGGDWSRRCVQPFDVGVRQDLVMAERGAEPVGGDDGHAMGVQTGLLDVGAVDAEPGGRR